MRESVREYAMLSSNTPGNDSYVVQLGGLASAHTRNTYCHRMAAEKVVGK